MPMSVGTIGGQLWYCSFGRGQGNGAENNIFFLLFTYDY